MHGILTKERSDSELDHPRTVTNIVQTAQGGVVASACAQQKPSTHIHPKYCTAASQAYLEALVWLYRSLSFTRWNEVVNHAPPWRYRGKALELHTTTWLPTCPDGPMLIHAWQERVFTVGATFLTIQPTSQSVALVLFCEICSLHYSCNLPHQGHRNWTPKIFNLAQGLCMIGKIPCRFVSHIFAP